jgi:transaldolase / glucose-6-phosphate isomerase
MSDIQFLAQLGAYQTAVDDALATLRRENILNRIRQLDHTVWHESPTEISNRLGWLTSPQAMQYETAALATFSEGITAAGFTHVLLLGMGGSSLAPELFSLIFGGQSKGLQLAIVDTTAPEMMTYLAETHDPATTLFIVATKSGGTAETLSAFTFFYNWVASAVGGQAGDHFVAITDPGSALVGLGEKYGFRRIFLNDPNIGGRYSVLSHFGLVPASLLGVDVPRLLQSAIEMSHDDQLSATVGAIMGALAKEGRDKLTFVTPAHLASLGDWAEQLIAESTGKNGVGILPVVGEPLGAPEVYGNDRVFVAVSVAGEKDETAAQLDALQATGHPVLRFVLPDLYAIGGQFFMWEMATAVASHLLGVQPFDQPNVESAKIAARAMVKAYHETGAIPAGESQEYSREALRAFAAEAKAGDYLALQAYLPPTAANLEKFRALQAELRDETKLAVTFGFGPRFLHSTGQLHKGDGGNGHFVQFTYTPTADVPIPDQAGSGVSAMSFGVLLLTQALGDGQALRDAGRRVIRFHE